MSRSHKMPLAALLALTVGPAIVIGATLWVVNDLIPACTVQVQQRLTGPDARFDLVVFSRICGTPAPNTQATLVPVGDEVHYDAASFVSIGAAIDLVPRWVSAEAIEIAIPADAPIFRQDETVAGIAIAYR